MTREYTDTECPLYGTDYCKKINMVSCEKCTLGKRDRGSMDRLKSDLDTLDALMPEDGIYELFGTDECVLCKGEEKGERTFYGVTDLGNPSPERTKRSSILLKGHARAGSIVPVQLSCCSACRRRFVVLEYITMVITAIAAVLGVLLIAILPLNQAMRSVWMGMPLVVFIAVTLGGWFLSRLMRKGLVKKYSQHTHLDIFEIPKLAQMKDKGWFELVDSRIKGVSKLVFTTKRMQQGVYTGDTVVRTAPQKAEAAAEIGTAPASGDTD